MSDRGWEVHVIVVAPSGNTDAASTLAHGLDEEAAYDLWSKLDSDNDRLWEALAESQEPEDYQ